MWLSDSYQIIRTVCGAWMVMPFPREPLRLFGNGRSRKRQEQADERRCRRGREFSFLTIEANGVVGPVHSKAMPVLPTTAEEWRAGLEAPVDGPPAAAAAARGRDDG